MSKFLTALLLIVICSSMAYGATSDDMSVYVRQDVFDAKMEAFMAEIRLMNEQLRGEIRKVEAKIEKVEAKIERVEAKIEIVNSRVDNLEKRMSALETMIYWILSTLAVAFAALALTPYLKDIRKPSLTVEDVKRLIAENNIALRNSLQGNNVQM